MSRAKTTLSNSPALMRATAESTADCHSETGLDPGNQVTLLSPCETTRGRFISLRTPASCASEIATSLVIVSRVPVWFRIIATSGITKTEFPGSLSKANEAKAIGSSPFEVAHCWDHQRCARLNRSGPWNELRVTSPQPTIPI